MNELYFGDNLNVLKEEIPDNSIDLIYLDPPFQSGRNYNIIFDTKTKEATGISAQIQAFTDTWRWGEESEKEFTEFIENKITKEKPHIKIIELMRTMRNYLGECSIMAYLTMMAPRLLELKRVLKGTGSIYLHCDPTASHYLKLLMDAIFGPDNFRNEIIWCYSRPSAPNQKQLSRVHDVIFWYSKGNTWKFYPDEIRQPYSKASLAREGYSGNASKMTKGGKVELKKEGKFPEDWIYIPPVKGNSAEYLGYPTQKPEALLERIIKASSNEGDLVLDPFCGCGTTIAVAQGLNRKWIGIDITYLAIDIIEKRLEKSGLKKDNDFAIRGIPADEYSAMKLAEKDSFQFQYWAISRIPGGIPNEKKTGDKGIDGIIYFKTFDSYDKSKIGKAIISVKGGKNINPAMVRDLIGTIQSNNADFGILITLPEPTQNMKAEAIKQGYFQYGTMQIPKVQIISTKDLFAKPLPIKLPENSIMTAYYDVKNIKKSKDILLF
jgi:site-specific DNA-methyltransferase (adenine-specific)